MPLVVTPGYSQWKPTTCGSTVMSSEGERASERRGGGRRGEASRSSLYRPAASSAKTVTGTGIGSKSGLGERVMSGEQVVI